MASKEKSSFLKTQATKTLHRTLKTQGSEWFHFFGYRVIGWSVAFLIIVHPVFLASIFREELNSLFKSGVVISTLVMTYTLNIQHLLITFLFEVIYMLKLPFFEKWKANEEPWPWEEDPVGYKKHWRSLLKKVLINMFIIAPIANLGIVYNHISWNTDFNNLPSISEIFLQLFFCFIMGDFCFYWGHRA